MRVRTGEELPLLFSDVGRPIATLAELYDAAEARYGLALDWRPDPDRPAQPKWQHDLRWELQSAGSASRITKRADLGRAIYEAPPPDARVASPRWDAIFTVPRDQDIDRWRTFDEIYAPGAGRPGYLESGAHLWLRYQGRLVWRSEVVAVEHRSSRQSSMDGTEHGPGWSILLAPGERADLTDRDIGFEGPTWGQGLRYLDADLLLLRGSGRPSPRQRSVSLRRLEQVSSEPVVQRSRTAIAVWNRREAELLADWVAWCETHGREVRRPVIPTDEGTTIIGDAFDETRRVLVEAKGSSSREHLRMAIGQILDYSALMNCDHQRAVLVPVAPPLSLQRLMDGLEIGVIYRHASEAGGFIERLDQKPAGLS